MLEVISYPVVGRYRADAALPTKVSNIDRREGDRESRRRGNSYRQRHLRQVRAYVIETLRRECKYLSGCHIGGFQQDDGSTGLIKIGERLACKQVLVEQAAKDVDARS